MEPQDQMEKVITHIHSEPGLVVNPDNAVDSRPSETTTDKLAARLRENGSFDWKLTRAYGPETIANAVSNNWGQWDKVARLTFSGWFINAYNFKDDFQKGYDITALRALVASNILDMDPDNSLRILASIALRGVKKHIPTDIHPKLCKAIQLHFLQGDIPRYTKLLVKGHPEEMQVVLQHVVSAISGPLGDTKDPQFAQKQLQLVMYLLDNGVFNLLDQQSVVSIIDAAKSWPISMLKDLAKINDHFTNKLPNELNPFKQILPPVITIGSSQGSQPDQPVPELTITNLPNPNEAISIISDCFNRLEREIAAKKEEVKKLVQAMEQSGADKLRAVEVKDKKQRQLDELQAEASKLRGEIDSLKNVISNKNGIIQACENERDRLSLELSTNAAKISALQITHEEAISLLANRIDSVSEHKVNELKRSIEIDLKNDYDELEHLPRDEACEFHMHVLETIFRKLREKGMVIGGGRQ